MNEFTTTFNRLLAVSGKSINQVAELADLDRAYVLRLSRGTKDSPSPRTIMRLFIAISMDVALVERDPTIIHGLDDLLLASVITSTSKQLAG
jgi:transcriptional regulator with XRE-family HTH domain